MASANSAENTKFTGTSIPVGALKTKDSCGIGEFLDLIPFADFCKSCSLEIIQLLPVNDTGTESSPYSALSAFALHPVYISLKALPEVENDKDSLAKIEKLAKKYEALKRFSYKRIRTEKLALLRSIFEKNTGIKKDPQLKNWISKNPWVRLYAVFMIKKQKNLEASWKSWSTADRKVPDEKTLEAEFSKNGIFYAWVQMRLDEQFSKASGYIKSLGIKLKGDIPIMMNEDSCDAWAYPEYFNSKMRAGSPPDGFNPVGQNWGFPTYNWDNLKKDGYSWWKQRLVSASKYYQIFRIDHVLGFFRIWATPERETTAALGWTLPFEPIKKKEFEDLGFDIGRITWLSKPHVQTCRIQEVNGGDYGNAHFQLSKIMDRIGSEELWRFNDKIQNDVDIWNSDCDQKIKERLAELWRDRTFIEVAKDTFSPNWSYESTTAWNTLNGEEKEKLTELIKEKHDKMEKQWEKQATCLLGELTKTTSMIACAEDLGSNPACVPAVLKKLGIYSLRVIRWNRKWSEKGQPFFDFDEYPALSVTTSSVHDSSTLRSWWLFEKDAKDFYDAFPPVAENGKANEEIQVGKYDSRTARYLLAAFATSKSAFCIHPIQDFLSVVDDWYDENPDDERVNIPGSVTEFNWTYRLPVSIEKLAQNKNLIKEISLISGIHKI